MLLLLLVFCAKCVVGEPQSTTVAPANATVGTSEVTKVVPTNASFAADTTCNVNDTSCAAVAKSNATATTAAKKSSASTAAVPQNSSTTPAPTTATPAATVPNPDVAGFINFNPEMCTCDLQRQFCDINCCCDNDCSNEDKMVFRSCKREPNLIRDTSFCQYMDYIYINNTPYAWEVNQNGLFCIAKSNLPVRYTLQKKKPIITLEDVELQKRNKYSWPDTDSAQPQLKFNMTEAFVYGAKIWVARSNALEPFQLPDSFVTNICLIKRNMKFLQNYRSKCSQMLSEDNPNLSAETYFKDMLVIRSPRLLNVSLYAGHFEDCPKNVCLPIEAKVCDDNYQQCRNFSVNDPRRRASCHLSIATRENICAHVTRSLKYNFYHNGTRGFTKVELLLVLKNVSYHFGRENFEFSQQFDVDYFWSNYTLNYSSLLSGNPGYVIGKPVLTANIVTLVNTTNSTSSNKTEDLIHIKVERNALDIADNFLIFPANRNGVCVLNNHTYVASEFGYNMILKCKIRKVFDLHGKNFTASDLCRDLQKEIFKFWPISGNLSDVNKLAGSFGNANASVLADWTKILSNRTPGQVLNATSGNFTAENTTLVCNNLITTLKIDIFHSRVDFKDLCNQEKIVGTSFEFGTVKAFQFSCNKSLAFEAAIREELMFFDVTSERIQKFVDPPTFKISLPYDFFYPFIKVGSAANVLHLCPLVAIFSTCSTFW